MDTSSTSLVAAHISVLEPAPSKRFHVGAFAIMA